MRMNPWRKDGGSGHFPFEFEYVGNLFIGWPHISMN